MSIASSRELVWDKYIGSSKLESLCYVGCGSIISKSTFINCNGKPVCNFCSNNLHFTEINEFKNRYKLTTPDCYLNINDEITSDTLIENVLKENQFSIFSSKYGYKYAISLLLTIASKYPNVKICVTGFRIAKGTDNGEHYDNCQTWLQYHNISCKSLDITTSIQNLVVNHNNSKYPAYDGHYQYDIILYHFKRLCSYQISEILEQKRVYDEAIGKKTSMIVTYENDYDNTIKADSLDHSTNFISVGIKDKTIIAIIEKLNNKSCDKELRYNYVKLFGGQKIIGTEII